QTLDWEFTTERPRVSDTSPPHQTRDHTADTPVLVWMTHPVDLDAVQEALEVKSRPTGRDDAPWDNRAFRLRRLNAQERKRRSYGNDPEPDALSFVVEPAGRWPLHHTIQLAMKPTLVGRLGPLPMGQPWTMQFETYAPLHTEVECVDKGCRPMPIEVTFNNPVLIGQERYVTLTPKPKSFRIESLGGWEDERTTTTLVMYGAFEPDIPYTVTIAGAIRDTYGQRLGQKHTAQVIFDPPPSTLNLSDTSGVLAPGRARTIGVAARRVAQIRVRVAVLNDAQILQLHAGHKGITMGQYPQPFLSIDALGATSTSHTLDLTPSKPTDWSSTALDLEALSGISEGVVLIEVEPTAMTPGGWARPSTKQGVYWLSDIGGWVQVSAVSSVVRLARLSNGDPISGAEVAMWWGQLGAASSAAPKDKRNTVWWGTLPKGPAVVGTTDDQGLLRLPSASDWPRVSNTGMLWVNKGNARALVPLGTSVYGAVEPQPNLTALKASERIQASVITERGVYRPGEPVHVVGWSAVDTPWTASGLRDMPLGVPVTLTLIDPDGNEVATHNTETGPHGKIGATLPIPDDGALGRYRVHADFAQGTYHTNRILKVEDYRTPEFEVQAAASRHAIIWGESNTIRATGNYTFGGPVEIIHINHATRCSRTEPHLPELEASWHVGTPRGGGYGVGYPLKS
ncbi:MAG: MG2 domain-containing protein, partial [Myxococcota bacterium]